MNDGTEGESLDIAETGAPVVAEIDATAENTAVEREEASEGGTDRAAVPEASGEPESAPVAAEAEAPPAEVVDEAPTGDTLIPITHPDGGSTDALPQDEHGNFLCRAEDYAMWVAHGFVVVADKVAAEIEKVL